MPSKLAKLMQDYRTWYQEVHLPEHIDVDDPDALAEYEAEGWHDPLAALVPLNERRLAALQRSWDPLPRRYVQLVTEVGVGTILSASADEPTPFQILPPKLLAKARTCMKRWLAPADRELAERERKLDVDRMLPFFADDSWAYFAVLTRRTKADERVVLFDHAYEQGHPFGREVSLLEFFELFVARAHVHDTINPFRGLR